MEDKYDKLWESQLRLCELSLAQLIRLYKWRTDGVVVDDDQDLIVGENAEVVTSLQRQKDKKKEEILSIQQKIRTEKEREKRKRELNAQSNKK